MPLPIDRHRVERACRLYHTTAAAASALDVTPEGLSRACKRLGIETPSERKLAKLKRIREGND